MSINATRQQYPLSKKLILKNAILVSLGFLLFQWVAILWTSSRPQDVQALAQFHDPLPAFIAHSFIFNSGMLLTTLYLTLIMLIIMLPYQALFYRSYNYQITDDHVVIKKGVFSSTEITIPFERMQDVFVNQDILDRILNLYDLNFSSATSSRRNSHIDGLDQNSAETLQKLALAQVKAKLNP